MNKKDALKQPKREQALMPRKRRSLAEQIGATGEIEALAQQVRRADRTATVKVVHGEGIDLKPLKAEAALFFVNGQIIFAQSKNGRVVYSPRRYDSVRAAFDDGQTALEWLTPNTVLSTQGPKGALEALFFPPTSYPIICQYDALFEQAPGVRFTSERLAVLTVPMPGLLFVGYGNSYSLLAVPGGTFDPKATLCQVPLPNCYSGGGICWGNNDKPPAGKGGLMKAWRVFWETVFTTASVQGKSRQYPDDVRRQLVMVADSSTYPMGDLTPAGVNAVKLVERLLKGGN
jgi:hypothetical protein